MADLFAVDPGGRVLGWAKLVKGELVGVGLSRTKEKSPFLRAVAHRRCLAGMGAYSGRVVCEAMHFRQRENKCNPQDLIDLNLISGHVGTEWRLPHTWKGMVPKKLHQPKILAALKPKELALVEAVMPESLRHNAIDAVGIGLHAVGRLEVEGQCHHAPKLPEKRSSKSSKSIQAPAPGSKARSTKRRGNAPPRRSSSSARKKLSSFRTEPLLIPERLTKPIAPGPDTQTSGYLDIRKT